MAKSRKKAAEPVSADTNPDADVSFDPRTFDPEMQAQAGAVAQGVVEQSEPPAAEQPGKHAEAVARRGPRYNQQGIKDSLAGAELLEHHDPYLSVIRFAEKPSDAVREMLREANFQWNSQNKEWARAIRFDTRQQDRLSAERLFDDVCKMIRTEKGITHSFGGA